MVATISLDKSFLAAAQMGVLQQEAAWSLQTATRNDMAEIKALFWKLHAFNSSLDPRFALSEEWENCFEAHFDKVMQGQKIICVLARDTRNGKPAGFILASVHTDSSMWKYREWVEVEALFVEKEWRGSGVAEALLASIYEWAESQEQSVVQLYVTATNERAIRFYRNGGFQPTQMIMRKELA